MTHRFIIRLLLITLIVKLFHGKSGAKWKLSALRCTFQYLSRNVPAFFSAESGSIQLQAPNERLSGLLLQTRLKSSACILAETDVPRVRGPKRRPQKSRAFP